MSTGQELIIFFRNKLGTSIEEMAKILQTPLLVYQGWEDGSIEVPGVAIVAAARIDKFEVRSMNKKSDHRRQKIQRELERKRAVLDLRAKGHTQTQIAKELGISQSTVCGALVGADPFLRRRIRPKKSQDHK